VSGGSRGNAGEFNVTINWQETDGYAPRTDSDLERGYDNLSANLYASRHFGNSDVSVRHWRAEGNVEYLGFSLEDFDQDFMNSTTAVELNTKFTERSTSKIVVSFMQDEITQNQSNPFVLDPALEFAKSDRISLDWQYSHVLGNHRLTGGLYAVEESARSLSFGDSFDEDTNVRAAFLQDQWSHNQHRTVVALRLTDHESFGKHTTWNAEYAYDINEAWTFNAGLGHAFRAPDATDRFGFGGNANLSPELSDEAQLGLRYSSGTGHRIDIEFYSNDIDDLIEVEFRPPDFFPEAKNIAKSEIRGAQLGYEYRGDRFVVRTDITKQSADNAISGERLLRRAEETATLTVTRDIGTHRFGLSLIASGDREDFGGLKLPGYVLANLTGQIRLNDAWMLHARIENLLDTEYQTAANYRMQERGGFIELKYGWN
jgi:vitamin B12 transporter